MTHTVSMETPFSIKILKSIALLVMSKLCDESEQASLQMSQICWLLELASEMLINCKNASKLLQELNKGSTCYCEGRTSTKHSLKLVKCSVCGRRIFHPSCVNYKRKDWSCAGCQDSQPQLLRNLNEFYAQNESAYVDFSGAQSFLEMLKSEVPGAQNSSSEEEDDSS